MCKLCYACIEIHYNSSCQQTEMAAGGRAPPLQQRASLFATRGPCIVSVQRGHRGESAVLSVFAPSRVLLTPPIFLKGWIAGDLKTALRNQRQRLPPPISITTVGRLARGTDPGKRGKISRRENSIQKLISDQGQTLDFHVKMSDNHRYALDKI